MLKKLNVFLARHPACRHPSRGEVATLFRLFEGHLLTILDANIGVSF